MKTDFEKLTEIINEAESLLIKSVTSSSPEFVAWKTKAERFLISKYGDNSHEYSSFKKLDFTLRAYVLGTADSEFVDACHKDIEKAIAIFKVYLEDVEEEISNDMSQTQPPNYSKVFIVHGHDGELKQSVARIIEKQGIDAIILSEKANQGRTIIEKFEDHSDVSGAICLFTADDTGKAKTEVDEKDRARQNVVLETGYFMGKLGRDHVVILADKEIEMPSDLAGIVYSNSKYWEIELLRELKAIGYTVDLNNLI